MVRKEHFTVAEAAEFIGCTRQHIYDLIGKGRLPYEEKEKVIMRLMINRRDAETVKQRMRRN